MYLEPMSHASHRFPGPSYRPTAHQDALQRASKAKAHLAHRDALSKASCDLCGASLGLVHTEGRMWDIKAPHYTYNLKLLCLPCVEAVESRGMPESRDIFGDL